MGFGFYYAWTKTGWVGTIRFAAYVAGIFLLLSSVGLAQDADGSRLSTDLDLLKWAVTQGGLVLVTLTILWSYRKDFRSLLAEEHQRVEILSQLVRDCTSASAAQAETLRELTRVIDNMRD